MRNNLAKISVVFGLIALYSFSYISNDRHSHINPTTLSYKNVKNSFTIVIDAGHGGKDSGTLGKKSKEKDIALEIALKLGKKIESKLTDVKVIFTRKDDTFLPLFERIAIANEAQADVFISIHCNASSRLSAKGTETYVMGLHTADENLETAKRENSAILLESDFQDNYDGYDPNSDAGHIILSMYQNVYLDQSIEFASLVEDNLGIKTSRGVKQAGFVVLRRATMPAVLIETGFLSNPDDEKMLLSDGGQKRITDALFKAFASYKKAKEDILLQEIAEKEKENQLKVYRIQVAAKKEVKSELFSNVEGLEIIKEGNLYKYVTRPYNSYEEATFAKEDLVKKGYNKAFIVVYPMERTSLVQK